MGLMVRVSTVLTLGLSLLVARTAGAQLLEPTPTPPPMLAAGDPVMSFDAVGLDGTTHHITYPKDKVTVLLFLLSSCHICHGMIPEWSRAYDRRAPGVDVVGVVLDQPPPGVLEQLGVTFPVVRAPEGNFRQQFKIFNVPQTIRVVGGRVDDAERGHIDAIRVGQLFRPLDPVPARGAKPKTKTP